MIFDVITIFPEIFHSFKNQSILKKAQEKGIIKIRIHNLRDFTHDPHKTVDDKPFGGGRGMVVKVEPIFKAISTLTKFKIQNSKFKITNKNSKIILFTPRGKKFNQKMATDFAKLDQLILICGRYEGVDERVAKYIADECLSIGKYVLMGGDLAALVVIEAVARLVPGVVGKSELLKERITESGGFIEYPQYTRPEIFEPLPGIKWRVPKVLLSGDHKKIEEWRKKHSKVIE